MFVEPPLRSIKPPVVGGRYRRYPRYLRTFTVTSCDHLVAKDLRKEYESFFEIFATERYLPDVQFVDPLTSFTGLENYRSNVDMLGGRSLLGKILFKVRHVNSAHVLRPYAAVMDRLPEWSFPRVLSFLSRSQPFPGSVGVMC